MGENKIEYTLTFSQSLLSRADILMLQILITHKLRIIYGLNIVTYKQFQLIRSNCAK